MTQIPTQMMYKADPMYLVDNDTGSEHPFTRHFPSIFVLASNSNCSSKAMTFSASKTDADSSIVKTCLIPGPVKLSMISSSEPSSASTPQTKSPPATSSISVFCSPLQLNETFSYFQC